MLFTQPDKQLKTRHRQNRRRPKLTGDCSMNGTAILENVRRYRAIASLYRQTATFRPSQRLSLLEQAHAWESRAIAELEAHFATRESKVSPSQSRTVRTAALPMLN